MCASNNASPHSGLTLIPSPMAFQRIRSMCFEAHVHIELFMMQIQIADSNFDALAMELKTATQGGVTIHVPQSSMVS